MVIPDPIPNSEVKHAWANDSPTHVGAKVGGCPLINTSPFGGVFILTFLFICVIINVIKLSFRNKNTFKYL